MKFYEVGNIEEAIELAYKLKDEGRYDWFRGQVQELPPYSSLYRLQKSENSEMIGKWYQRWNMYYDWIDTIPELRYLRKTEHVHDLFAIMQHYGIPTHYIDFTTDPGVAGFFAADTTTIPTERKSCIYCLNTADLMELWDIFKETEERKEAMIELVTIDVKNLWRLQAQNGVFLFANYKWDIDYPMDRIIFPYSGYPAYPTRDKIYPDHKSQLEQLLDQYFSLERTIFTHQLLKQMFERINKRGGHAIISYWEELPDGFYADAFPDRSRMSRLKSWSPEMLREWEITVDEHYFQTAGPTLRLKLNSQISIEEIRKSVIFGINQILRSNPNIRSKTVDWEFTELPQSLSRQTLSDFFRRVWNGMRLLPYTNSEVADAFGSVAALLMVGFGSAVSIEDRKDQFFQCFGDCIRIGFANQDRSSSTGYASKESLQRALRKDFAELLAPEYKEYINDIQSLFKIIYNPAIMFEFNEFKTLFALEVIPAQVVKQEQNILFNPAHLITFGIP